MTVPVPSLLSAAILVAIPGLCPAATPAAADTKVPTAPVYQEGYDPAKEQREGIGTLPDAAWGQTENGLQAALSGPDKVKFNEPAEYKLVLRNVSPATLKVAVAEENLGCHLLNTGGTGGRQLDTYNSQVTRWILQPGQQTVVRAARMRCTEAGDLFPIGALSEMTAGAYDLTLALGAGHATEVLAPNGKRSLVPPPPGEWSGRVRIGNHRFELLAEKVPLEITPPPEFPAGLPGFAPFMDYPALLRENSANPPKLGLGRTGLCLMPHPWRDAYWIQDSYRYSQNVYWGPFTAAALQQAGIVQRMESTWRPLPTAEKSREVLETMLRGNGPMAAAGLRLAAEAAGMPWSHRLSRTIQERRRQYLQHGLEKEMRTALEILTKNDPPLPPAADFTVISQKELPRELPATAWGPEEDGLRAAALMPRDWRGDGVPVPVRLFIRNFSTAPVYLTVSDRAGYDYPSVVDVQGAPAKVEWAHNYPSAFSSVLRPETDPVQDSLAQTRLTKILLQPGAVCEAPSPGMVRWFSSEEARKNSQPPAANESSRTFATITGTSSNLTEGRHQATITWHLHSANGTELTGRNGDRQVWPARGGWTGVLETGPLTIQLWPQAGGP